MRLKRLLDTLPTLSIKEEAKRLIDALPDNSSWSDLMYEIYVRREIEEGVADLDAGRSKSHEEVTQLFRSRK
jgi:predicted transcriptional regulator